MQRANVCEIRLDNMQLAFSEFRYLGLPLLPFAATLRASG